jgi:hypothetical protein
MAVEMSVHEVQQVNSKEDEECEHKHRQKQGREHKHKRTAASLRQTCEGEEENPSASTGGKVMYYGSSFLQGFLFSATFPPLLALLRKLVRTNASLNHPLG